MRIAIIGTGISGSLAARLLSTEHRVTVFEASDVPGGHASTVDFSAFGGRYSADVGFMVFNRRTYPNFCHLLRWLGVPSRASDMSFSVRCGASGLEYQGSSLNGLFAQRRNCLRASFLRMLGDIVRFNRAGLAAARQGAGQDSETTRDFLRRLRVGPEFVEKYFLPMTSAIWSSRPGAILDFPASFLIGFFANHGLLQIRDRPVWRTIVGGSRTYVSALLRPIRDRVYLGSPIASVRRTNQAVLVEPVHGPAEAFDEVVFATHADQTLALLSDANELEREVLASFPYQANEAVLHTDSSLLPKRRRAWASWNYHIPQGGPRAASVTYDLSRLQGLETPAPVLLTLNATSDVDPARILRTFQFHHPAFRCESVAAQRRFGEVSGRAGVHFCGAYWGYGFHEDGVNSALAVAKSFGIDWKACIAASTKGPSSTVVESR